MENSEHPVMHADKSLSKPPRAIAHRILRWFAVVTLGVIGLAVVGELSMRWHVVVPWKIVIDRSGRDCSVYQRMPRQSVYSTCGLPRESGNSIKAGSGDFFSSRVCGGTCDVIGNRVIFYDCEDRVAWTKLKGEPGRCMDVLGDPLDPP